MVLTCLHLCLMLFGHGATPTRLAARPQAEQHRPLASAQLAAAPARAATNRQDAPPHHPKST